MLLLYKPVGQIFRACWVFNRKVPKIKLHVMLSTFLFLTV